MALGSVTREGPMSSPVDGVGVGGVMTVTLVTACVRALRQLGCGSRHTAGGSGEAEGRSDTPKGAARGH